MFPQQDKSAEDLLEKAENKLVKGHDFLLRTKARVGVGGIRECCHPARAFLLCLLEIEGIIKRVR